MLVGLRCGPWLGQHAWGRSQWDLGAAHEHPDINSFQVFADGTWLLVDPGYTYRKRTSDHSTMLIDGVGQLGENVTWFATEDAARYDHYARISRTETNEHYDYVVGDGTGTYHPGLGLKRYVRHWLFLKPTKTLVIVDDLAAAPTGYYKAWTRERVQFAGMKVEDPRREFLVPDRPDRRGKVWFDHDGLCGTFDVDIDYFDNAPGKGHYVLAVAGKVVARWTHDVQETDLHVRTIPGVKIHQGDRVELRGEPFGVPGKFIKMVVSSRASLRAQPHQVQLLLHAPPAAKVTPVDVRGEDAVGYTIDAGAAALDVWATAPGLETSCGEYQVVQGSRIKQTQRIVLSPQTAAGQGGGRSRGRYRAPAAQGRCPLASADRGDLAARIRPVGVGANFGPSWDVGREDLAGGWAAAGDTDSCQRSIVGFRRGKALGGIWPWPATAPDGLTICAPEATIGVL